MMREEEEEHRLPQGQIGERGGWWRCERWRPSVSHSLRLQSPAPSNSLGDIGGVVLKQ